jgi:hypothetical protein
MLGTGGNIYLTALQTPLKAGVTYTSISVVKGATNLANQTNHWFALIWKDGSNYKILRSTTDATNAAWNADATKTLNLSSTYTPGSDTRAYIGVMIRTSSGSTGVTAYCQSMTSPLSGIDPVPSFLTSGGGYTTPLADGTTLAGGGAGSFRFYAYVS